MTEKTPIELPKGTVLFQNERFQLGEFPENIFLVQGFYPDLSGCVVQDYYEPSSSSITAVDMAKSLSYIRGRGLEIGQVIVAPSSSGEIESLIVLAQTPQVRKDNS